MEPLDKVSQYLKSLGFDNHAEIVKNPHVAPTGESVALGTSIEVGADYVPPNKDSIYVIFIVSCPKDIENVHISMMIATYYGNLFGPREELFNRMYSASKEKLPTKEELVIKMKGIINRPNVSLAALPDGEIGARRKTKP